jgi:hypothetical protein
MRASSGQLGLKARNVLAQSGRPLRRQRHPLPVLHHAGQFLREAARRPEQFVHRLQGLHRPRQYGEQGDASILLIGHLGDIESPRLDQAGDAEQAPSVGVLAVKHLVTPERETVIFERRHQLGPGPTRLADGADTNRHYSLQVGGIVGRRRGARGTRRGRGRR